MKENTPLAPLGRPARRKYRKTLNTTIESKTLDEFRIKCQELAIPMNVAIEAFMRGFNDGDLIVKIGKNTMEVDEVDE